MTPRECRHFDRRLEPFLSGAVSSVERSEIERHAESCVRCGELLRFAVEPSGNRVPDRFTSDVLARTSGSACGRAEALLAGSFDEALDASSRDLVRSHTDRCPHCEGLERSLVRQATHLTALAEIEPDERFSSDVLARTIPAAWPNRPRTVARKRVWERWLERPRFAWEAAYVGAMAVWLLVGPTLALSASAPEPLTVARETVLNDARELGTRAWHVTGKRGIDRANALGLDLLARYHGGLRGASDLGRHAAAIRATVVDLDAETAALALRELRWDLGHRWSRIWSTTEDPSTETERKERAR